MSNLHLAIVSAIVAAPAVGHAASVADSATSVTSGVTGVVTAITAAVTAVVALIAALRSARSARKATADAAVATSTAAAAEARAKAALAWADRLANAQQDGVVLLLSYPGTKVSCRALLEVNGWRVAPYSVSADEVAAGRLLPGPHVVDDVRAADAIVIEGGDERIVAALAANRDLRDNIRSGCGVALHTAGNNVRYDLALWGECDQGVTTPVTTEGAVRASLARREATARRQGIRPGALAEARAQLRAA